MACPCWHEPGSLKTLYRHPLGMLSQGWGTTPGIFLQTLSLNDLITDCWLIHARMRLTQALDPCPRRLKVGRGSYRTNYDFWDVKWATSSRQGKKYECNQFLLAILRKAVCVHMCVHKCIWIYVYACLGMSWFACWWILKGESSTKKDAEVYWIGHLPTNYSPFLKLSGLRCCFHICSWVKSWLI